MFFKKDEQENKEVVQKEENVLPFIVLGRIV